MTDNRDEIDQRFFDRINAVRDERAFRLSIAENVTTNGRLVCALLAAANYAAGEPMGVAAAAVPVALAWAADLSGLAGEDAMQRHCSVASIGTAVGLAIVTLINCW